MKNGCLLRLSQYFDQGSSPPPFVLSSAFLFCVDDYDICLMGFSCFFGRYEISSILLHNFLMRFPYESSCFLLHNGLMRFRVSEPLRDFLMRFHAYLPLRFKEVQSGVRVGGVM